jgi:3-hydroxybutyryl-CoA dehydrogenase
LQERIRREADPGSFRDCDLVIEAIVEDLEVKRDLFHTLEGIVGDACTLATNTSSLSIAAVAGGCRRPERVLGLHFFNPAPLLPLVEIVPGLATDTGLPAQARALMQAWGKTPVIARDTPGFIVNRIARPFYGEALRIYEEGIAEFAEIDAAMKSLGGFRMGPFELMDLIGNDVNYQVTASVWEQLFYDPRYRPSITQKRLAESGRLGRKTGQGYYAYGTETPPASPGSRGEEVFMRILSMLINEAADALYLGIAGRDDIELAMTRGVNYPKGLLKWADEIGVGRVYDTLCRLRDDYREDRYRPSILLRRMAAGKDRFFT